MKQGNLTVTLDTERMEIRYQTNWWKEEISHRTIPQTNKQRYFSTDLLKSKQIPIVRLGRSSMIIIGWCGWIMIQQRCWRRVKCFPLCSYDNRTRGRVPGWLLLLLLFCLCRRMRERMPDILVLNWRWCLLIGIPALVMMMLLRWGGFLFWNVIPIACWRWIFYLQ